MTDDCSLTSNPRRSVKFLFLTQEDVIACGGLDMAAALADIEDVFRIHVNGDYVLPSKVVLRWGDVASEETLCANMRRIANA